MATCTLYSVHILFCLRTFKHLGKERVLYTSPMLVSSTLEYRCSLFFSILCGRMSCGRIGPEAASRSIAGTWPNQPQRQIFTVAKKPIFRPNTLKVADFQTEWWHKNVWLKLADLIKVPSGRI